ncbi:PREDICTED: GATA zinc finger domain-containing protein 14-like [Prunus mume]|uniref:GATA zinc finger domain-containing protein 14-like n=1 Tax=Prunus mume TaxID=102107 RepID=A0ABM0PJ16_PRUMU|nr:PREDICTED: GATA zinc finger domain-containing protein 14-like [Prunus mume]
MDRNNYLCWKSQFQDILEIHDLEEVVKSDARPDKKLADGSINPAYSKDKLVLSWIKATSSPQIKTLLIPCTTASEAWSLLDKRLSPLSKTYIRTQRDQIRTLKKESENTVAEYLMHAKSLYDSLVAAGSQMTDEELIEDGSADRSTNQHENSDRRQYNNNHSNNNYQGQGRGRGRGRGWYSNRDRNWSNGNNYKDHNWNQNSQRRSWNKSNTDQQRGNSSSANYSHQVSSDTRPPLLPTPIQQQNYQFSVICQQCNKVGHTSRICPERGNFAYLAETNSAAVSLPGQVTSPNHSVTNWCVDSGATHHMTSDPSSLSNVQPYTGQQDGQGSSYWQ